MPLADFKPMTFKDYLAFPENSNIQIIDGIPYNMSPSPSRVHQKIIVELVTLINNHLKAINSSCEVYSAPLDVIFVGENENMFSSKDVVQPDIFVVCDKSKLSDKGVVGSPDFIIEIVSPSSASIDYVKKLNLYNHYKVKEYWIINPNNQKILVYKLQEDKEFGPPEQFTFEDEVKIDLLDLKINFKWVKNIMDIV
ncbi:hypothetical protein ABG79_01645 [Caloramator mitchellensis]|uniref:Putative restriction endonuclease domain-containing protein n=1 Tax=Caloramator mitchellensis TaxID=908809 RepID=A0A0R3JSJ7_CALMK|nr:Uma2 family endonuclease [Caloramator mitchellensis]KRQ86443.1 hypothetical protein ABG79_01645 [Caloramator mitchellensis]